MFENMNILPASEGASLRQGNYIWLVKEKQFGVIDLELSNLIS